MVGRDFLFWTGLKENFVLITITKKKKKKQQFISYDGSSGSGMDSTLEMSLWKMAIMMIIYYYYLCGLNCGDEIKQINWLINKCEWRICFLLTLGILLRICLMPQLGLALPAPSSQRCFFSFFWFPKTKYIRTIWLWWLKKAVDYLDCADLALEIGYCSWHPMLPKEIGGIMRPCCFCISFSF